MMRQPQGFKDANFFTHSFLIPVLHEWRVMDEWLVVMRRRYLHALLYYNISFLTDCPMYTYPTSLSSLNPPSLSPPDHPEGVNVNERLNFYSFRRRTWNSRRGSATKSEERTRWAFKEDSHHLFILPILWSILVVPLIVVIGNWAISLSACQPEWVSLRINVPMVAPRADEERLFYILHNKQWPRRGGLIAADLALISKRRHQLLCTHNNKQ